MKKILPFFLFIVVLASCGKKEVDLSALDYFTSGSKAEWIIKEISENGFNGLEAWCSYDDRMVFSKGTDSLGNLRIHKKNEIKCSDLGELGSVDNDEVLSFRFSDDQKRIIFGVEDEWNIEKMEDNEIIYTQPTRRVHLMRDTIRTIVTDTTRK